MVFGAKSLTSEIKFLSYPNAQQKQLSPHPRLSASSERLTYSNQSRKGFGEYKCSCGCKTAD
jgi:hypothetical protein